MNKSEIEALCTGVLHWKAEEDAAKARRIAFESELAAALATKDDGTDKAEAGQYRVTVTSKLTRTLDYEAYLAIESGLPEGVRCVRLKPELDIKKLRALEMVDPDLPAQFITTKPAKASVKVELKEAA